MTEEQYEKLTELLFNTALAAWSMSLKSLDTKVFNDLYEPQIGDFVFELSNPFVPKLRAIGKLVEKS